MIILFFIPKRPGEPDKTFANIKKIEKIYNWKPKVTLDMGMKIILSNLREWDNTKLWKKMKLRMLLKTGLNI